MGDSGSFCGERLVPIRPATVRAATDQGPSMEEDRAGNAASAAGPSAGLCRNDQGGATVDVMAVAKFERFFREAAGLDVDKADLRRFDDFIASKLRDMFIMGEATAKANDRDVIEPQDLPITKGLQENVHRFRKMDEDIEIEPLLERMATWPQLDAEPTEDTRQRLPELAGGLSVALARSFSLIDPNVRNPQSWQWERAFQLFNLLL
jgi:hypothetical protein